MQEEKKTSCLLDVKTDDGIRYFVSASNLILNLKEREGFLPITFFSPSDFFFMFGVIYI
jgi:hypothetical protein